MPKTSTAETNDYICPGCGGELCGDHEGRGFVRHKDVPECPFERGEHDDPPAPAAGTGGRAEPSAAADGGA